MAIASGRASRVDRLISIGLLQKKGANGLLASYMAAAEGYYSPKTYTEQEDMKALLLWKLGGNRVAEINHRANNAPSISYLRTRSTVVWCFFFPLIIPSHQQPTADEVEKNVEASFNGVLEVIHSQTHSKPIHTVLMFDELATEKRFAGIRRPTTSWGYAGSMPTTLRWSSPMRVTWRNYFRGLMRRRYTKWVR